MLENRHYRCSQPKNAVPFATGSCRKFKPEVLGEWKAPQGNRKFPEFPNFRGKGQPSSNFDWPIETMDPGRSLQKGQEGTREQIKPIDN